MHYGQTKQGLGNTKSVKIRLRITITQGQNKNKTESAKARSWSNRMDGSDESNDDKVDHTLSNFCYICEDGSKHTCILCNDHMCDNCTIETDDGKFCTDCNSTCTTEGCRNVEYVMQDGTMVDSSIFFSCDDCCEPFCSDCINEIEMTLSSSEVEDDERKVNIFLCQGCTKNKHIVMGRVRHFLFKTQIQPSSIQEVIVSVE